MNFDISKVDSYTVIKINVEKLDTQFAPELKSHVIMANKSGEANLIIDMAPTKYCDSSGLSSLLVANRLCRDAGGMLVISSLQDQVMKLITISQLHNVLNISPSVEDASALILAGDVEE